jgi:alkanesulfonate monooxygenase SsuD/methylene tetrahydromethanopterin reductase-like flavin-dependent oxidoreductase (luciferase family)
MLSLYIGGMGSREQNFYNRLVSSYGFEAAAREVQDLYLAGKKTEAAMALPGDLIDAVSIVGSKQRAKERIRAFQDAGVETLIVSPMAFDNAARLEQLRLVAELAGEVV